jgi:3-oxoacyl-[acyl-carrier-protein] synthase II
MSEVCIVAAEVVSGLGHDLEGLWQGLLRGESAIAPVTRFATGRYLSAQASVVPGLGASGHDSLVDQLLDLLLDRFPEVPADSRLITASTKGRIDVLERLPEGADPSLIPMNGLLDRISERYALKQPAINVNAACASSTVAVARAAALISAGLCSSALVVAVDMVSEFVFSGFSALHALSPAPCRPFDRNRDGLTLGEGAAALLLMSRERAVAEGRPILGVVAGWGAANDATHITAPARDACGLIQAVRQALSRGGLNADAISGISAHGTATPYNDQMELTAFRALFGERNLPMGSIKGAVGHTLGAAGAIQVAVALKSLESGVVPPTVGLTEVEPEGEGMVSAAPQPFTGRYLLSTNSGFGGVNGALILGRGE